MASFPTVSIVVPVYNQEKYLEQCLTSLVDSDYPGKVEVLVCDDGSTDKSLDIAKRYASRIFQFPGPSYITGRFWENMIQYAFKAATGKYIGWFAGDDFSAPDRLLVEVTALEEDPSLGGVYTSWANYRPDGTLDYREPSPILELSHIGEIPRSFFNTTLLTRREAFMSIPNWDKDWYSHVLIGEPRWIAMCAYNGIVKRVGESKPYAFRRIHGDQWSVKHRDLFRLNQVGTTPAEREFFTNFGRNPPGWKEFKELVKSRYKSFLQKGGYLSQ